jgi:hypothetical protein
LIRHRKVLPQTALLGTVPPLELSRIVLLRVLLRVDGVLRTEGILLHPRLPGAGEVVLRSRDRVRGRSSRSRPEIAGSFALHNVSARFGYEVARLRGRGRANAIAHAGKAEAG